MASHLVAVRGVEGVVLGVVVLVAWEGVLHLHAHRYVLVPLTALIQEALIQEAYHQVAYSQGPCCRVA